MQREFFCVVMNHHQIAVQRYQFFLVSLDLNLRSLLLGHLGAS
jgi:hypothetical protein